LVRRVAIVGCGLVGAKRARALGDSRLVVVADIDRERARGLAEPIPGCAAETDWRAAVARADVEVVIVATTNDSLAPVALAAVQAGKHVLVEKPAARHPAELAPLLAAARERGVVVRVGFNHRFHPALRQARALLEGGELGPLMYLRGRYGHGGRAGYEREWRARPEVAGGGELLDQGVHLIDLARWFGGDFAFVAGHVGTFFWDMPVEDNGFVLLKTRMGQVAWLHASWTEWKNTFSFEVFARRGKLQVDGLGGSYGLERLTLYRMRPEMGPPETTGWEYPGEDSSWLDEYASFVEATRGHATANATLEDASAALHIVQAAYGRRTA
jgi:predicted dehydrogenase